MTSSTLNFDVTIVGAGPAGVSCAVWLQQLGFTAVLVDKQHQCGGLQLRNPWTNTWIASSADATGPSVAKALHENALRHGCGMRLGVAAQRAWSNDNQWHVQLDTGEVLTSRFLVLAGGVVPKSGGLMARASLLIGPGAAIADTDFRGKRVAILGGGDNAFENHQFISQRGALAVHIYARTLRARAELLETVPPENVFVGEYLFDDQRSLVNHQSYDQVVVLYGYEANAASLLGLTPLMQPNGFVMTDAECKTSLPGVWAVGELAQRAHPCCVTAMADGVVAAKSIQRQLETSRLARYVGALRRGGDLLVRVRKSA